LEINLDGTGQYLVKDDGYFVCPDYCLKFANPTGFTCFPTGDHCSVFSSESGHESDADAPNLGEDYAQAFNPIYPDLARQRGVRVYPFFLDGVAGRPDRLLPDGMHPNAQGVEDITARLAPRIAGDLPAAPGGAAGS
jgi:lysophospholipase L1-like esterase